MTSEKIFKEYDGREVTIMSCSNCNMKCKHCYISYTGNFKGEELLNMVNTLSKKYNVTINGTEPLLHRDYLESIKVASETIPITNGWVFKDNFGYLDTLKEYGVKELKVSYHFDLHKIISPVPMDYLQELFKEITKRGIKLTIMCSLSAKNYKNIPEYCEQAIKLGASSIKFTNFISQGSARELDKDLILTQQDLNDFFCILRETRQKYDKNILNVQRCGSFGNDETGKSNFNCPAGKNFICITPNYKVYPCVFLCKEGNEIGYYEDGKIFITKDFQHDEKVCISKKLLNGN